MLPVYGDFVLAAAAWIWFNLLPLLHIAPSPLSPNDLFLSNKAKIRNNKIIKAHFLAFTRPSMSSPHLSVLWEIITSVSFSKMVIGHVMTTEPVPPNWQSSENACSDIGLIKIFHKFRQGLPFANRWMRWRKKKGVHLAHSHPCWDLNEKMWLSCSSNKYETRASSWLA